MSARGWAVCAVFAACALCGGCGGRACDGLVSRASPYVTAAVCARAYADGGEEGAGIAAAEAFRAARLDEPARQLALALTDGPEAPRALRVLAAIALDRGQFDPARAGLERALSLDRARGDHAGAYADAAALVTAHWVRSELAEALPLAQLACAEARASGQRRLIATSLIALGSVLQAGGDSGRALDAYAAALDELPAGELAGRARVLLYRGAMLAAERQVALARPALEEARSIAGALGDHALALAANVNLADLALTRGDLDGAERALDRAEAARGAQGRAAPSPGILVNRAILARTRGDLAAARRALDEVDRAGPAPETAWIVAEQRAAIARAAGDAADAERHYRAAIAIIEELWRTASPAQLRSRYFEDRLGPYHGLFALAAARGDAAAAFASASAAQGRMFQLVASAPALSPADVRARLASRHVLCYVAAAGRVRLLVLSRGEVRLTSVDVSLAELEPQIDDFLAHPDDAAAAKALGDALVPPEVAAALPPRFYLVPDGALHRVPFAALVVRGERLVARHAVAYAPSAAALAQLVGAAPQAATPPVVVGDAAGDLRHAASEIEEVAAAAGAARHVGGEATIGALRASRRASLLHVVSHSVVTRDGGALPLADGALTASEIVADQLAPRLVVLATCASAVGAQRDRWGSLAAAFLAAGSADVVATMFSVEDRVAAAFVRRFYRAGGARDPVSAVADAQRALAAELPVSAWAGFLVMGL